MQLSERDLQLLSTLTHRVRSLSVRQLACRWWGQTSAPVQAASRRLRRLEEGGHLELGEVLAHDPLEFERPLATWAPGEPTPALGAIAYQLRLTRWSGPLRPQRMVAATDLAVSRVGGVAGRLPRPAEGSHDLSLGALYLHHEAVYPARAQRWSSESQLYAEGWGRNSVLPDAVVREGVVDGIHERERVVAIELAGRYSKAKLHGFHTFCYEEGLPYELW